MEARIIIAAAIILLSVSFIQIGTKMNEEREPKIESTSIASKDILKKDNGQDSDKKEKKQNKTKGNKSYVINFYIN